MRRSDFVLCRTSEYVCAVEKCEHIVPSLTKRPKKSRQLTEKKAEKNEPQLYQHTWPDLTCAADH